MTVSINDVLFKLNEMWLTKKPQYLWSEAGPFARMLMKTMDWEGDPTGKLPVHDRLSGMAGPNYSEAYNNSVPSSGSQFRPIAREHHQIMRLSRRALGFGTAAGNVDGIDTVRTEAKLTGIAFLRSLSYLVWGDGTGRIAKGDGAYSVSGNVITFLNSASTNQFERGDRIVLIEEGATVPPSGQPTPRVFAAAPNDYLEVTKVGKTTITLDKNVDVGVPTAVNTDYIGKTTHFGTGSDFYGLLDGFFRWVPPTDLLAASTLFGVDRSVDTQRLAGRRVLLTGTPSAYEMVSAIGEELLNAKGVIGAEDDYCLFVPSAEMPYLMQEAKTNGVVFQDVKTTSDVQTMTLGVQAVKAAWPGLGSFKIVLDHFLHDPAKTKAQDRTYAMVNLNDWKIKMESTGISWKNYEESGNQFIKNIPGSKDFYGEYGITGGNLICENHGHQILAKLS